MVDTPQASSPFNNVGAMSVSWWMLCAPQMSPWEKMGGYIIRPILFSILSVNLWLYRIQYRKHFKGYWVYPRKGLIIGPFVLRKGSKNMSLEMQGPSQPPSSRIPPAQPSLPFPSTQAHPSLVSLYSRMKTPHGAGLVWEFPRKLPSWFASVFFLWR